MQIFLDYFTFTDMNKDVSNIFTATADNKVVVVETNLKAFVEKLRLIEPKIKSYDIYYREFKKADSVEYKNDKGKTYNLQKMKF